MHVHVKPCGSAGRASVTSTGTGLTRLHLEAQLLQAGRQRLALLQRHQVVEPHAGGGQGADQHAGTGCDDGACVGLRRALDLVGADASSLCRWGQGVANGADAGAADLLLGTLRVVGREGGREGRMSGWRRRSRRHEAAPEG